ncbi:phage tail tape measure protein [Turicibacter sanguinis]|uniref:phage tail tape measure protein n=1 Tax=Turicibacter sanguinis TaxID=154288 RepID=UPI0018A93259|nr:phage tail tape measure protein [Turicibacter sanguinis]MDB8553917.1 phage tail tape measure protein [Turicibacter sanguinis]
MAKTNEIERIATVLTLEAGSFEKQVSNINKLIANNEKQFKSAAKGVGNYEKTFEGLDAKIKKTTKQLELYQLKLSKQQKEHEDLSKTLKSQIDKLNDLEQTLSKNSDEWKKQAELVQKNSQKLTKLTTDIKDSQNNITKLTSELAKSKKEFAELGQKTESLDDKLEDLSKEAELSQSEFNLLASELKASENSFKNLVLKIKETSTQIENGAKKIEAYSKEITDSREELSKNQKEHQKLATEIKSVEQDLEHAKKEFGENSNEARQLGQRLLSLKDDYQKLENEIDSNKKTLDKYQVELNNTKAEVNQLSSELKQMPFDKVKSDIDGVTDKLKGISGAAAGIEVAGVAAFGEASNAVGKLKGALGLTSEQADKVYQSVQDLAKRGFDFDSALEILIRVNQVMNDLLDPDEINEFSAGVLAISNTFDQDLNDVIKASSSMIRHFGIDGEEALDIISYGLENGLDMSNDFLDTLWEYSNQFSDMGFTAKDTLQIINQGMKDGAFNTDKLADGVKEFNIRLSEVGADQEAALGSLNMNVQDVTDAFNQGGDAGKNMALKVAMELMKVEDETERNQLAVALFGTMYEDVGDSVVTALTSITDSSIDVEGKTNDVKAAFEETFGAEVNGIMQEMKEPLIEIAEKGLIPILEVASDLITEFAEWFSGLDEGTIQTIAKMGLITMAIAPVLSLISNGIGIVGRLAGSFGGLSTNAGFLTTILGVLSGPVGIGLAIAALTALLTYVGDNENAILWLQERFGGLGIVIGSVCEFISGIVQLTFGNMGNVIGGVFDIIGAIIDGPGGLTVSEAFSGMMNKITMTSEEAWGKIETRTTRGMSQMRYASDESLSQLLTGMEATMSQIPTITEGKYNEAAHIMGLQLMNMDSTQLLILQGMNDTTKNMFQGIREGMTISEAAGQVEKNLKQMSAAGRLDSDTLNKDISAAMKNLSEQMDVQTEIGSKEATENTSMMKDNVSTNILDLETDVSDSVIRLEENATSSSNDMNTNASMSADIMKTNVTNSTKTMANQAESDWNRLRSVYGRSINGNITVTRTTVERTQRIVDTSYAKTSRQMADGMVRTIQAPDVSQYRLRDSYYVQDSIDSQVMMNSSKSSQNANELTTLVKGLMQLIQTQSGENKIIIQADKIYVTNEQEINKLAELIDTKLKKLQQRKQVMKGVGNLVG